MIPYIEKVRRKINAHRGITPAVEELHRKVKGHLPPNPIILEAGAHLGYDTYALSKCWPSGTVLAFEPVPEIYQALKDRVKGRKNVKTFNCALGEEDTHVEMYVSEGYSTASSSILEPTQHRHIFPSVSFTSKVTVPMQRVDSWATQQRLMVIDMLWLDMQGYEVFALKGCGQIIESVSVIYTELCRTELYGGMITRDPYIAKLKDWGFQLQGDLEDAEVTEGVFINQRKFT